MVLLDQYCPTAIATAVTPPRVGFPLLWYGTNPYCEAYDAPSNRTAYLWNTCVRMFAFVFGRIGFVNGAADPAAGTKGPADRCGREGCWSRRVLQITWAMDAVNFPAGECPGTPVTTRFPEVLSSYGCTQRRHSHKRGGGEIII